ncbi:MAG: hypothetical protein LBT00_02735 [Spirochaetaceae bacterium]|nr:hypothetical protein [Spirochaetaceae bacterium]
MPPTGLLRFARNDGRNCRHCEEQRRSNPDGECPPLGCSLRSKSGPLAMTLEPSSLRGAKRRSNPNGEGSPLGCFASPAMTGGSLAMTAGSRNDGRGSS